MANNAQDRVYKKTNDVKFGLVAGPGKGLELPMAAGVYWARRGGKFVTIGGTGNATPVGSDTNAIWGWAEVETKDSAATYPAIKTSAGDKAYVIFANDDNIFEMPAMERDASLCATIIGRGCGIVPTGSTYGSVQKACVHGSNAASPLIIVDYNKENRTVLVRKRLYPTQYM